MEQLCHNTEVQQLTCSVLLWPLILSHVATTNPEGENLSASEKYRLISRPIRSRSESALDVLHASKPH